MPLLNRYLGNPVLSLIGRTLFASPVGDFHCGLRGFEREAILQLHLHAPGMEFASEMIVKSILGFTANCTTTLSPDGRRRAPHLRPWRDGWRHLRFMLLRSPQWLFLYPGLLLTALGLAGATTLTRGPLRAPTSNQTQQARYSSVPPDAISPKDAHTGATDNQIWILFSARCKAFHRGNQRI